ncbi:MAG: STAS domain-containing protein [Roseiflexaceae bacterium]
MQHQALRLDDPKLLQARLQKFMNWLLAAFATLAVLMTIMLLRVPTVNRLLGTASIYGLLVVLLVARFLLAHRPVAAVTTISAGFFCLALADVVLLPRALPAVVFLPVMAIAMALPYLSERTLLGLSIAATLTTAGVASLSEFVKLFQPAPGLLSQIIFIIAVTFMCGLTLFLFWHYHRRQNETLARVRIANAELQHTRAGLEAEVAARTDEVRKALNDVEIRADAQAHLLDEIAQQRALIRDLSVPVLPVSPTTLVMPLVGALDSARLRLVQEQALRSIERTNAQRLVLDITGVPLVDSQVAQGLLAVVQAARLLGAEAVLVGVRPEVAQTMVGLGLVLPGLRAYADLQTALGRLSARHH